MDLSNAVRAALQPVSAASGGIEQRARFLQNHGPVRLQSKEASCGDPVRQKFLANLGLGKSPASGSKDPPKRKVGFSLEALRRVSDSVTLGQHLLACLALKIPTWHTRDLGGPGSPTRRFPRQRPPGPIMIVGNDMHLLLLLLRI